MTSQPDALTPSPDIPVKLSVFEGPLDLLLYLIRRNEIDIYDIPIKKITKQYLSILNAAETSSLDLAGDFFVMASNLMYIKSRMLLPANEHLDNAEDVDESDCDPRWELVQQLIEYKKFKQSTQALYDSINYYQDFLPLIRKTSDINESKRPLQKNDSVHVWNAFNLVMQRLHDKISHGEIHDDSITMAERMTALIDKLQQCPIFYFSSLFEKEKYSINYIVATFLAILELSRLNKIRLTQDTAFGDIHCAATETDNDK